MKTSKTQQMKGHIARRTDELRRFLSRGGSLAMLRGVPSEKLDALYAKACEVLEQRDYQGARNIFTLLSCANHWNIEYWLGLGICEQRLGEHHSALCAFARAEALAMQDPRSRFYAALSYQMMGQKQQAFKAITACLMWCGSLPAYQELRAQAEIHANAYKDMEVEQ